MHASAAVHLSSCEFDLFSDVSAALSLVIVGAVVDIIPMRPDISCSGHSVDLKTDMMMITAAGRSDGGEQHLQHHVMRDQCPQKCLIFFFFTFCCHHCSKTKR